MRSSESGIAAVTGSQFGQVGFYLAVLVGLAVPVGFWIYRAMEPQDPRLRGRRWRLDSVLLRLCGIDGASEMTWVSYGTALVVFNAIGAALLYLLQRLQAWLPLNPQHLGSVSPDTAFNTAVSFASNTSWQAYSGETTMSYLSQIRRKLGDERGLFLQSDRSVGYRLAPPGEGD